MATTRITAGALQDLHLSEIAQMVSLGAKTARVTVESAGEEGHVWFSDGSIVHAQLGQDLGEEALYRLLSWRSGRFFIEHGVVAEQRTIEKDTMYLVMEGLRRGDEASCSTETPELQPSVSGQGAPGDPPRHRIALAVEMGFAISVLGILGAVLAFRDRPADGAASPVRSPVALVSSRSIPLSETEEPRPTAERPAREISRKPPSPVRTEECPDPSTSVDPAVRANLESDSAVGPVEMDSGESLSWPESAVDPDPAFIEIRAASRVKDGELVLLVDGQEVRRRELAGRERGGETFAERVSLTPGPHVVVAKLVRPRGSAAEDTLEIDLGPGATVSHELVLGRLIGKDVLWK